MPREAGFPAEALDYENENNSCRAGMPREAGFPAEAPLTSKAARNPVLRRLRVGHSRPAKFF